MVATVGVLALGIGHAELRHATVASDTARARVLAISGVDLAMTELAQDAAWRTDAGMSAWSAWIDTPPGRVRYKLFDESDGDLTDDPSQACRLVVQAEAGDAVRYLSVELEGDARPNLVANPDFESSTTAPWYSQYGSRLRLDSGAAEGDAALRVKDRLLAYYDATINLDPESFDDGASYAATMWLKYGSGSSFTCQVVLTVNGSASLPHAETKLFKIDGDWGEYTLSFSPQWTGHLETASLAISGYLLGSNDIYVDSVELVRSSSLPPVLVPGTWRMETADSIP